MINNQKIKKLAIIAASSSSIPEDIKSYVLTILGKKELKTFLSYYRRALDKKRVYITSSNEISSEMMKELKSIFDEKDIMTSIDPTVGGGLKLIEDDMVVDFTFKKYINDTIEKLKN